MFLDLVQIFLFQLETHTHPPPTTPTLTPMESGGSGAQGLGGRSLAPPRPEMSPPPLAKAQPFTVHVSRQLLASLWITLFSCSLFWGLVPSAHGCHLRCILAEKGDKPMRPACHCPPTPPQKQLEAPGRCWEDRAGMQECVRVREKHECVHM